MIDVEKAVSVASSSVRQYGVTGREWDDIRYIGGLSLYENLKLARVG